MPWYIMLIKMFFINICITYISFKIECYKHFEFKRKLLILSLNLIFALLYTALRIYLDTNFSYIICYLLYVLAFSILMHSDYLYKLIIILISMAISLICMCIASIISYIILKSITSININTHNIIEYVIIGNIQLLIAYLFFRIKRFKDGFQFCQNNKSLSVVGIIISIVTIIICILYGIYNNYYLRQSFIICLILGGVLMFNWIKRSITNYYKKQMKDRTVEIQAEQLKEKDEIISNLKSELESVLKINHKYNHRLSSMELAVNKLGNKMKLNEEFAKEYSDILDSISELSKEYKTELAVIDSELPKTNVYSIDNILEYMKKEANKYGIKLELKIKGSINYMVENIVSKSKLETLIGDHIKDAIIAINSSKSSNKNILVVLGIIDKYYELQILDTGIEFEIPTLLKLGKEAITTHKDTGGSGIGFMTTFETMQECKASLIIEEKQPISNNDYTKSITIRFDGKNEYIIKSYRADKIQEQKTEDRIIIENF